MTFNIIIALSTFLIAILGTRLTILAARHREAKILPPVLGKLPPRKKPDGGIAVVFALVIGLMMSDISFGIVLGLLILAGIGVLHEWMELDSRLRVIVQAVAVALMLTGVHQPVFAGMLPPWADKIATGICWLWIIRAFHAMDHLEGLACSQMIATGAGIVLLMVMMDQPDNPLFIYGLVTACAGLGFVWWNWYPGKILLSETGSAPVGFFIGYLLIYCAQMGYGTAAVILPGYMLTEYTLLRLRKILGKPNTDYYVEHAVKGGIRADAAARYVIGANILLAMLAVLGSLSPEISYVHGIMAYATIGMILGFFVELSQRGRSAG